MALSTTSKTIDAIWRALSRPAGIPSKLLSTWTRLAEKGWINEVAFEDALLMLDPRLDREGLKPASFAEMLEITPQAVFTRPGSRFDEHIGFLSYRAADAAAMLILMERLGFTIDPEPLCARLRQSLLAAPEVNLPEINVLFHDKSAHRTPPLTLESDVLDWRGRNLSRLKTDAGYAVEIAVGDDKTALSLTVKAPLYRKRPEPKLTTCDFCGMSYVKGLPSDDKEHRATHRRCVAVLEPQPNRQFQQDRERDPLQAPWVDANSQKWKRDLVYRRAYAFKREMKFDFTQWSIDPAHDPDAVGYLFADDEGRVVGAAGFRPQQANGQPWLLDWIWLAPAYRRSGLLSAQWEAFRQRFGDFDLTPPLSEAMQAFLSKRGRRGLAPS